MDMLTSGTGPLVSGVMGFVLGVIAAWWWVSRQATAREAKMLASARDQMTLSMQNMRNANTKLQAELEKERALAAQGQEKVLSEQRALVLHLQSQLRAANMEMDRLQRHAPVSKVVSPVESAPDTDGFAMTRPFER